MQGADRETLRSLMPQLFAELSRKSAARAARDVNSECS